MEWYVNDMSLTGQFATPEKFKEALEPLLQLRSLEPNLRDRLYCTRSLASCPITASTNIQQAVMATKDKSFMQLTLGWLGKSGPFWDDNRQFIEDDYFEYKGHDVTEQGLGEAARRKVVEIDANVFSFQGSLHGFANSPVPVQHGLSEDVLGNIPIDNYWDIKLLRETLASFRTINSWQDVQVEIAGRFGQLNIPAEAMYPLMATPFSRCVSNRVFELLDVLNNLVKETDENGHLSEAGMEILTNHFSGEKAWFTDESEGNKTNFKTEMTFKDPRNDAKNIFCPWHGKIKTPQTRIHFEWPRPAKQREIKVLYLGPKITKK
jgi:hypothetical protein